VHAIGDVEPPRSVRGVSTCAIINSRRFSLGAVTAGTRYRVEAVEEVAKLEINRIRIERFFLFSLPSHLRDKRIELGQIVERKPAI
jgi:hypothetical protein